MHALSELPHVRGVSSRSRVFIRWTLRSDNHTSIRPSFPFQNRKPRKCIFSGVVTELFSSFTFKRNRFSMNRRIESMTR